MSNDAHKVTGAPGVIWIDYLNADMHSDAIWTKKPFDATDIKYVRADVVEELVDSLILTTNMVNDLNAAYGSDEVHAVFVVGSAAIAKAEGVLNG